MFFKWCALCPSCSSLQTFWHLNVSGITKQFKGKLWAGYFWDIRKRILADENFDCLMQLPFRFLRCRCRLPWLDALLRIAHLLHHRQGHHLRSTTMQTPISSPHQRVLEHFAWVHLAPLDVAPDRLDRACITPCFRVCVLLVDRPSF